MSDTAEKVEQVWYHDWKQFVIIPVQDSAAVASYPLFCARCPRCNRYYTQPLAYNQYISASGQLDLPQFGCRAPE